MKPKFSVLTLKGHLVSEHLLTSLGTHRQYSVSTQSILMYIMCIRTKNKTTVSSQWRFHLVSGKKKRPPLDKMLFLSADHSLWFLILVFLILILVSAYGIQMTVYFYLTCCVLLSHFLLPFFLHFLHKPTFCFDF